MFADSIGDPRVMEGAFYVAANYPAYAATWWWKNNEMNKFVDRGNTVAQITKRVNGGYVKTLPSPSPTLWASRTHPSFSWLTRTLTRSTPSGPSRVGSKLPLPMYADLRNIDDSSHSEGTRTWKSGRSFTTGRCRRGQTCTTGRAPGQKARA